MGNCAVSIKGIDTILSIIEDAVMQELENGRVKITGSNGSRTMNPALYDFKWTTETDTKKKMSGLPGGGAALTIKRLPKKNYRRAVQLRAQIGGMSEDDVRAHVRTTFYNFSQAQIQSLTTLYLAVWADIKISEREVGK